MKTLLVTVALALSFGCASNPAKTPVQQVAGYGVQFTATTKDAQAIVIASTLPADAKAKAMVVFDKLGQEISRVGGALKVIDSATSSPADKTSAATQVTNGIATMRSLLRSGLIPLAADNAAVGQVLTLFDTLDKVFAQVETSLASIRENR